MAAKRQTPSSVRPVRDEGEELVAQLEADPEHLRKASLKLQEVVAENRRHLAENSSSQSE